LIMGRGWGQGPTHSQNFHSWFAHIPGLKVVMPATAEDAKGLLIESIFDDNPVLFLEQRWLHNMKGDVPEDPYRIPLGKANLVREGSDVTIVSMSIMTVEAIHAADFLRKQGITCDIVDLRSVNPIDWLAVFASIRKTGRLLALDNGHASVSVAGEVVARSSIELWNELKCAPQRLAMPDFPESTSPALTKNYHVRAEHIVTKIAEMLGKEVNPESLINERNHPNDVPGEWFTGPF
jgi:acetoin:2,6-dichlorophenolindophenol oxidoreductase subunit beta